MSSGQKYSTGSELNDLQTKFGNKIFVTDSFNAFGLFGERIIIRPCPSKNPHQHQVVVAGVWGAERYAASFMKATGDRVMVHNLMTHESMPLTWRRDRPGPNCELQLLEMQIPCISKDIAQRVEHYIRMAHQYHIAAPERFRQSQSRPLSHRSLTA